MKTVEDIVQKGEWTNQMRGPQLDAMAYYLYVASKFYRYTGDKNFMKKLCPFVVKVGDSLAEDNSCYYEGDVKTKYTDKNKLFKK